jgi:dolichol-phosphate mannosyltransferase
MEVLVVLPTYNESANIGTVLRRVHAALPAASVLVVDDGSPDGTADIAERIGKELGNVEVMRRHEKSGLGSAYRAGFRWGLEHGFDACVEMDSDLSHEPEALPDLVAPLSEGYELVIGSRYIPGGRIPNWAWHRRLLSRGGNVYASLLLGLGVADATAGFRAYAATVLQRIDLDAIRADGYGFQIEMTYATIGSGGAVTEVPIRFVDRVEGESKMSTFIVVEALVLVTWWGLLRAGGALRRLARPDPHRPGRDDVPVGGSDLPQGK